MELTFREAERDELEDLVALLANDALGRQRENPATPLDARYTGAFEHIAGDPNNTLVVVESEGRIAGMLQLTFIPYLTHRGSWRCLLEGVRVHEDFRGRGLGREMIEYAIGLARQRGCSIVQLTSDKQREGAIRFYESLGFVASHEGFKRWIEPDKR